MKTIEYTKDQRDVWYFSDGYQAPAHIAVLHLAALRRAGYNVERIYSPLTSSQPFNSYQK